MANTGKNTPPNLADDLVRPCADQASARCVLLKGQASWQWWPQSGEVHFSPEWRSLALIPEHEPLPIRLGSIKGLLHADDAPALRAALSALSRGKVNNVEELFRIKRSDSTILWILMRSVVEESKNELPWRIYGTLTDVSRLRMNRRFQALPIKDLSKTVLESSPDMIIRTDSDLFPLYANAAASRYFFLPHDEVISSSLDELGLEASYLDFFRRSVDAVFATGDSLREFVTFRVSALGLVSGEYSFWPEFGSDGQVKSVMTQFRDYTERVKAEQKANLNEARLAALYRLTQMDNAPEEEIMRYVVEAMTDFTGSAYGYIFVPHGGQLSKGVTTWSEGLYDFLPAEYLPEDILPEDIMRIQRYEHDNACYRLINNGDGINPLHAVFDGQLQVTRYMRANVMDGQQVMCVAAVSNKATDYEDSDLQQLEMFISGAWMLLRRYNYIHELQRAKSIAEYASKSKDEFLANVSHELRTPLNGILSMLQLLELSPLNAEQKSYLRTAGLSGEVLLRIISDILDFSRMESGKMDLRVGPFDIKKTLSSTLNLFAGPATQHGLTLTQNISEDIPDVLLGDDARIRQIIYNLVGNAIKFTECGGIIVECCRLPSTRTDKAFIYIAVSDTGIGMPEGFLDVVFDAFTQLDSSSTRKYSGTGLGLGIVRRLVSMVDGSLSIESTLGEGTSVHISLPFALATPTRKSQHKSNFRIDVTPLKRLDILVVEDDDVARFALSAFLRRYGHRLVCVPDGRQALEAAMLYPFDCIFTDIQMPGMDGLEVTRRIRNGQLSDISPSAGMKALIREAIPEAVPGACSVGPNVLITAVSAHAMVGDKERFLGECIDFYLSKPVVLRELTEIVKQIEARVA